MKKNKLTLYIFIALIAGIAVGYIYNTQVLSNYNNKISAAETVIKTIDNKIAASTDTTSTAYSQLKAERVEQNKIRTENNQLREGKVEYFTILSDIFLRLIKMIVAPLVFTTLVVGVAKVGDIKAVGRIGGKTLLWFISATLVSLLLGMLLVNFFAPGAHMNIMLPDSNLSTGIQKNGAFVKRLYYPRSTQKFFLRQW